MKHQRSEKSSSMESAGNGPRRRVGGPTPSMAVALVALFVALGGVSYAAATGSIDSREIKNSTVRSKDIRNNDVRGNDVRTGTLTRSDVRDDTLEGTDILESTLGTVPSARTASSAQRADVAQTAGNAFNLAGQPAGAFQRKVRWVQVDGDNGAIRAQSGGISVTRDAEGQYSVNLGQSTQNALISATGAELGFTDNAFVNAQRCGGPPLGTTCLGENTPNRVIVHTDDPDDAGLNDADFYLAVVQ